MASGVLWCRAFYAKLPVTSKRRNERTMRLTPFADCVTAFLIAALVPAILAGWFARSVQILPIAFGVTLAHAVILGLPLFLLLRWKGWANGVTLTAAGIIIGVLPAGYWASVDPVLTNIARVLTPGWIPYLKFLALFGALGALAGLTFWLALTLLAPQRDRQPRARVWYIERRSALGLVVAAGLCGIVVAMPSISKDRTCHNLGRDGRTEAAPQTYFDLQIGVEDWPTLIGQVSDFATTRGLSSRDWSSAKPDAVQVLYLSLCNEQGLNILLHQQHVATNNSLPPSRGRGPGVAAYEFEDGSGWADATRDLVTRLDATWPGKVTFRGHDGQIIPIPDRLRANDAGSQTR